jgi:hypothetical protein
MPLFTKWNDEIRLEVADDHFERPTQVQDVQAIVREPMNRTSK